MMDEADRAVCVGPTNLITDVAGITVGHAEDDDIQSGVTVVVPDSAAVAAVDSRGGGPGTRETDALRSENLVQTVDAIVLSGGSAFGLAAAGAVQMALAQSGKGFRAGDAVVPIVPSAILFDLNNGGDKSWSLGGGENPYDRLGQLAFDARGRPMTLEKLGRVGAGRGATAGGQLGGTGSASAFDPVSGVMVGALVAVNSFGSVTDASGRYWAAPFEQNKEFGGLGVPDPGVDLTPNLPKLNAAQPDHPNDGTEQQAARQNTTIAVIATDANLCRADCQRIAIMAQDGLARAIRPVHTPFDGDTVFVMATNRLRDGASDAISDRSLGTPMNDPITITRIGAIAADCLARAVAIGVHHANNTQ